MTSVIGYLKIGLLKRQLVEVEGNIKFYSGLIGQWEEQLKKLEGRKNSGLMEKIERQLEGNIKFNRKRIVMWSEKKIKLRNELREFGVDVKPEI